MKKLLLIAGLLVAGTTTVLAQKYLTRTGKISFDASVPTAPEVKAVNNEVASILDAKSGEVVFEAPVKSFQFERTLMQEHFNENYMESDKYPKADFKGFISNPSEINFGKDGTYTAKVKGKLTIHGVTNEIAVNGNMTVEKNTLLIRCKFSIKLKDYNISIPSVVNDKLGREASIVVESKLDQK
jgi:polyisoprenoid-binding protein YceI